MTFLRLQLGERIARIARYVDDLDVVRLLERRDDGLPVHLLIRAANVGDVQRCLSLRQQRSAQRARTRERVQQRTP